MSLLSKLEKRFGRFAVPNMTAVLVAGQVIVYGLTYYGPNANPQGGVPQPDAQFLEMLTLVPSQVLAGEVWRVVTFLFVPPIEYLLFAFFFWYFFYIMGTALEATWGTFRYNIYLLLGFSATVVAAFVTPDMPATNGFVQGSVFLAFAHLYPNFVIYLFFILPVKIKWLALLTWIGYFFAVATGTWTTRVLVLASVANFVVFFGREVLTRMTTGHRRMTSEAGRLGQPKKRVHRCTICGISSEDDRNLDFRYCSKCAGGQCYCPEHIRNHEHVAESTTGDLPGKA